MKLLLTSPDAIFDKSKGKFFSKIISALDYFLSLSDDNHVVVISIHENKLENIPKEYNPNLIRRQLRGSPRLIEQIKDDLGCTTADVMVLGANSKDVQTAANSKLILLNALYAKKNNPSDILYTNNYGIPINNADALKSFFEIYNNISTPWYYRLEVDERTTIYALTNANTFHASQSMKQLNKKFKECLKEGDETYQVPFMIYFLISTYSIVTEFEAVNYWGIYPSSNTEANKDLDFFMTKARQSYNGKSKEPLLIRIKETAKRHEESKNKRIEEGCNSQFDSIIINPYYQNKLKGKCVCIIDDFTTYGSSCETVRHLLTKAGVSKIIFIAMGKFGSSFYKYDYTLKGNVYMKDYKYVSNGRESLTGEFNSSSNLEFIKSLNDNI